MLVFDFGSIFNYNEVSTFNLLYLTLSVLVIVLEAWAFVAVLTTYKTLDWSFLRSRIQSKLGATNTSGGESYTTSPSASRLSYLFLLSPSAIYTQLSLNLHLVREAYNRANTARQNSIFQNLFETLTWGLLRIPYYVYNWVYSTNHKRIAVNYF